MNFLSFLLFQENTSPYIIPKLNKICASPWLRYTQWNKLTGPTYPSTHVPPLVIFFFNLCNYTTNYRLPLPSVFLKKAISMAFTIASTSHSSLSTRGELATKLPSVGRSNNPRYLLRSSHGLKLKAAKGGVSSVCEPLPADRPIWFPGSTPPEWLDGRSIL